MSSAEFARNQGWGPGTRVEGTNHWGDVVEIEITAIGLHRVLATRVGSKSEEIWTFEGREWVVTRKRRALGISPLRDADRDYMLASLEYGVNPLVGGWR